jgi:hypothetical protein
VVSVGTVDDSVTAVLESGGVELARGNGRTLRHLFGAQSRGSREYVVWAVQRNGIRTMCHRATISFSPPATPRIIRLSRNKVLSVTVRIGPGHQTLVVEQNRSGFRRVKANGGRVGTSVLLKFPLTTTRIRLLSIGIKGTSTWTKETRT